MRAASMVPLEVPGIAADDALAASGGVDVPGGERREGMTAPVPVASGHREQIPGERDPSNLTKPQPGAMGTLFNADLPSEPSTLTEEGRHERAMEGGEDKG
jgi:hypothetical protein